MNEARWMLVAPIREAAPPDGFGPALRRHLEQIRHPERRRASISAWRLLARALDGRCADGLPEVDFAPNGKPFFRDCPLYFSIAHSGRLCAASLADAETGVDVERVRPDFPPELVNRTLSDRERAVYDGDFTRLWCRKESVAKLTGRGMGAHPARIDTLEASICFAEWTPVDEAGAEYRLTAAFSGAPGRVRLVIVDPEGRSSERMLSAR